MKKLNLMMVAALGMTSLNAHADLGSLSKALNAALNQVLGKETAYLVLKKEMRDDRAGGETECEIYSDGTAKLSRDEKNELASGIQVGGVDAALIQSKIDIVDPDRTVITKNGPEEVTQAIVGKNRYSAWSKPKAQGGPGGGATVLKYEHGYFMQIRGSDYAQELVALTDDLCKKAFKTYYRR